MSKTAALLIASAILIAAVVLTQRPPDAQPIGTAADVIMSQADLEAAKRQLAQAQARAAQATADAHATEAAQAKQTAAAVATQTANAVAEAKQTQAAVANANSTQTAIALIVTQAAATTTAQAVAALQTTEAQRAQAQATVDAQHAAAQASTARQQSQRDDERAGIVNGVYNFVLSLAAVLLIVLITGAIIFIVLGGINLTLFIQALLAHKKATMQTEVIRLGILARMLETRLGPVIVEGDPSTGTIQPRLLNPPAALPMVPITTDLADIGDQVIVNSPKGRTTLSRATPSSDREYERILARALALLQDAITINQDPHTIIIPSAAKLGAGWNAAKRDKAVKSMKLYISTITEPPPKGGTFIQPPHDATTLYQALKEKRVYLYVPQEDQLPTAA